MQMNTINLWTDGAATMSLKNGEYERGNGGWAFIVEQNNEKIFDKFNGKRTTTNQEMELTAIYEGLKYLITQSEYDNCDINIYSDSAYCINIYTQWAKGWERNAWRRKGNKPIVNLDIIRYTWNLLKEMTKNRQINFIKVKGHNGNYWNEKVDTLAVAAKQL